MSVNGSLEQFVCLYVLDLWWTGDLSGGVPRLSPNDCCDGPKQDKWLSKGRMSGWKVWGRLSVSQ